MESRILGQFEYGGATYPRIIGTGVPKIGGAGFFVTPGPAFIVSHNFIFRVQISNITMASVNGKCNFTGA